ncbi:MAG: APC family permease [Bdellovibrionota bacterium]
MKFQKKMSTVGILFASISAMVGSGWLFSSLYAAQMAGPAAILSWVLAGIFVIIIALTFAEVGSLFPIAGGIANFPYFTHGKLAGFLVGWISWVSFVVLTPIEVQAALQYASNFFPQLMHKTSTGQHITLIGYGTATLFMFILVFINTIGIKFMSETNKLFCIWKLIIPSIAIITYFIYAKDFSNLTSPVFGGFAPFGIHGVFSALAVAGVIFSFNGFQVAILMAAESKNPQRSIPRAIIGAVIVGTLLYGFLQFGFLVAIPHSSLLHGWGSISFQGDAGPLAGLAAVIGAAGISSLLYVDAVIAPMTAGLVYVTSTSRILYGLSANGYVPKVFSKLNKRGIPIYALWINFFVGMLAFLPFPGWQAMVAFLSSILVATYAFVPICLISLRKQHPELHRTFRLPVFYFISYVAFFLCNLMLYWMGFQTMFKLLICVLAGITIYFASLFKKHSLKRISCLFLKSFWIVFYFTGITIINLFGSFGEGLNLFPYYSEYLVIAIFSLITLYLSQKSLITKSESAANIAHILKENHT